MFIKLLNYFPSSDARVASDVRVAYTQNAKRPPRAALAQSAERTAFNRVVGGSSPPSGAFFCLCDTTKVIHIWLFFGTTYRTRLLSTN